MLVFVLVFILLFIMETGYLKIADRLNIIDKPNDRSSHAKITARGGGVIFPVSLLIFFVIHHFTYPLFTMGLVLIAIISFADDFRHQSRILRLLLHFVSVALMLAEANSLSWPWWLVVVTFILCIGVINACNFMDGINGITCGYALVVMSGLWTAHYFQPFMEVQYLYFLAMGALVFAWFNFRRQALCFAGDVGSISMAFGLIFPVLLLIKATGNPIFILFFAVYGVDTVLTILHRLAKRENIFEPHRQHVFQYLANERKWSHIQVTLLYMAIQLVINLGVLYVWQEGNVMHQYILAILILSVLAAIHSYFKFFILRKPFLEKVQIS